MQHDKNVTIKNWNKLSKLRCEMAEPRSSILLCKAAPDKCLAEVTSLFYCPTPPPPHPLPITLQESLVNFQSQIHLPACLQIHM